MRLDFNRSRPIINITDATGIRRAPGILVLIATGLAFGIVPHVVAADPEPKAGVASDSLPASIQTVDGKIYAAPKLLRVMPDGLLLQYRMDSGGTGMTKVGFQNLPESIQHQFGFDPNKAAAFQKDEARAIAAYSHKLQVEEKKHSEVEAKMARPAAPGVSVSADPPTVEYSYYDPNGHRPFKDQYFSDTDGSRAATDRQFKCDSEFTFRQVRKDSNGKIHFAVETVAIHLGLSLKLIEPQPPSPAVIAHGEGHRFIDEHFYAKGRAAAQGIGEKIAAKDYAVESDDPVKAEKQALKIARSDVRFEYTKFTEVPTSLANRYYDDLTNEGRNNVDANSAAQQAVNRYENIVIR
jgi:hypothetical protein